MDDMNTNASGSSRLEGGRRGGGKEGGREGGGEGGREGGGRGVEWRVRSWVLSPSESSTK